MKNRSSLHSIRDSNFEAGGTLSFGISNSVTNPDCVFNGNIHITDESWPRNDMHIGKRIFPDVVWHGASM